LFNLAYGARIPSSNERYGYYLFNRQDMYDYIGNQHLKPEQSMQGELRFGQKFKSVEWHVTRFTTTTQIIFMLAVWRATAK